MRTLPRDPLMRFIWLQMKDRGPFDLRSHRVLFGSLNNRHNSHPLHEIEDMLALSVARAYARVAIGHLRGRFEESDRHELFEVMSMVSSLVESRAPDANLRIAALAIAIGAHEASGSAARWESLAGMSASILEWADRGGLYEPFDRVLDIPFYALDVGTLAGSENALDRIEGYRQANCGYLLTISPPPHVDELTAELRDQEGTLLGELRGARFIRLLPHLPNHYRRYGFRIDEALAGPPEGVKSLPEQTGLLRFDPFDHAAAERSLRQTWARLDEFHREIGKVARAYARIRLEPPSSADDFVSALRAHRAA